MRTYVNNLFHYPDQPPPSSSNPSPPTLARFIAYAPHRTRLTLSVTFAALHLLQRRKTRFITLAAPPGTRTPSMPGASSSLSTINGGDGLTTPVYPSQKSGWLLQWTSHG